MKEVGVFNPVWISHAKMDSIVYDEDSIAVSAVIKTKSGVAEASVLWTTDTTLGFSSASMEFVSGDSAIGYIPVQIDSTIIYYYISATSNSGRTVAKPIVAPNGFYKFIVDNSVPVELISFVAYQSNGSVELLWETSTELNNSGFEVERNFNKSNFEKIAFLPGFGTSSEKHFYSFTDKPDSNGKISYRLKQMDFNGDFNYSKVVEIDFSSFKEFSVAQNYPNPFNPSTKIKFTISSVIASGAKQSQPITLKVYDILGNEVATLVNEEKPAGTYEVEFNATSLPSGVYFYQLKTGSFVETKKMVLLK